MIPLIIGGLAAGALGYAGKEVAKEKQQEAEDTLERARDIYDEAKISLERQQRNTENELRLLGEEKYSALTDVLPRFVDTYSKFKNTQFIGSSGIDELENLQIYNFSSSDFSSIKQLADTSESLRKGTLAGGAAGAAIALGAGTYALTGAGFVSLASEVGIVAAADLAVIGVGGLVPGLAVVAGPALLIGSFASNWKAEENLEKAKSALAEARVAADKMDNAEYLCRQIERRSEMFNSLLSELIPLLLNCISELNRISNQTVDITVTKKPFILTSIFAKLFKLKLQPKTKVKRVRKNDFNYLSTDEKKLLAMSGALAKAIKAVIDTPMLDSNGELTYESDVLLDETQDKLIEFQEQEELLLEG